MLLLGKEKEGIPFDLLKYVDECVEIEQFGKVRSLNVHISAVLAVYQFVQQRAAGKDGESESLDRAIHGQAEITASDIITYGKATLELIEKKLAPLAHPELNDVRVIPQMHKIWGVR